MKIYRRNNFPAAVLNRIYEVDGNSITLRDYLNQNFYKVWPTKISSNQGRAVVDLEPGQSLQINDSQITRIN